MTTINKLDPIRSFALYIDFFYQNVERAQKAILRVILQTWHKILLAGKGIFVHPF